MAVRDRPDLVPAPVAGSPVHAAADAAASGVTTPNGRANCCRG